VRFTKRGITSDGAVRALASELGVSARDAGIAGMKDKQAVTTQTVSFLAPSWMPAKDLEAKARAVALDGIMVLDAKRHGNKLKPGHLAGNRFTIVLRGVERVDEVQRALEEIGKTGVPNAYGQQRFGMRGDNAERARAWLSRRAAPPRDVRMKRLLFSALQSELFNAVLAARVADGTWAIPLEGDLLKLRSSGGLFLCSDVQTDRERAIQGEVSPTGPMLGVKMRWPGGAPGALERQICKEKLGDGVDLDATRKLGEGSRRALRLWVDGMHVERIPAEQEPSMRVYFVLPKGAYATTVLGSCLNLSMALEETRAEAGASMDDVEL
jgi:tRNA pseudouridine13 synthase